jgi:hypothetical protein
MKAMTQRRLDMIVPSRYPQVTNPSGMAENRAGIDGHTLYTFETLRACSPAILAKQHSEPEHSLSRQ